MKKTTLGIFGILIALMLLPMLTMPAVYAADPSDTAPDGFVSTPQEPIDAPCDKLLVQDVIPWSPGAGGIDNPNYQACLDFGYTTGVVTSAMFAAPGFILVDAMGKPIWTVIIFASDQPDQYYINLAAASAKIAGYVSVGGVLVAHMCDMGWHAGSWAGLNILPGGVSRVHLYWQNLHIVNALDIFTGMTDAQISGWGWSTHGYFTNLVAGTTTLVTIAGEPDQPVYIEYPWGKGLVKANMMTLEWSAQGHSFTEPGVTGIGYTIIKNELKEAQAWFPEFAVPTVVVTSVLFAAMAIFLRRKRRLLIKP